MTADEKKKTGKKKPSEFMKTKMKGECWAGKVELAPNQEQLQRFFNFSGAAKYCWNRMLGWWNDQYEEFKKKRDAAKKAGKKIPKFDYPDPPKLVSVFMNRIVPAEAPWWRDEKISRRIAEETARALVAAFGHAFRRLREGKKGRKAGFPRFKKKGHRRSFTLRGAIHVSEDRIKIPNIGSWIKIKQRDFLPQDGWFPGGKDRDKADPTLHRYMKVTVSQRAGRWFVALLCDVEKKNRAPSEGKRIGVELGVRVHAYCSDGRVYENPEPLQRMLKRLRRLQRVVSRRLVKGAKQQSNRYHKAKDALARLHYRIACVRRDAAHKTSSAILGVHEEDPSKRPAEIVLRGSSYIGMLDRDMAKNKKLRNRLARRVADSAMGQLREMLKYKAEREGINVVIADKFFESTQTCSSCGYVLRGSQKLTVQSVFRCPHCGYKADRDENSSYNLRDY